MPIEAVLEPMSVPKALLVSQSVKSAAYFAKRLRERGCACDFAMTLAGARSLIETNEYCIVLSPLRMQQTSFLPLMRLLEGSKATLFFAHAVEVGCSWLPALRSGRKCFGDEAVRPCEFVSVIDEIIDEVRFHRNRAWQLALFGR